MKRIEPELLIADLEAIELGLRKTAKVANFVLGPTRLAHRIVEHADWLGRVIKKARG